jgi:hypothetical protein
MVSKRQLEANRLNARRSTGPITQEGKKCARMNALRHGLTAKNIVIGDEDPKEFEALREKLEHDLQPKTALEGELLDRLAGLLWRLRRIPAIEAAVVKARQEEIYSQLSAELEADKRRQLENEANRQCKESFNWDPIKIQTAMGTGLYNAKFAEIWKKVIEEEKSKGNLDMDLSDEVDEQYQRSRENDLVLLIRAAGDGGLIEKLSRYETILMNTVSRTLEQLRLHQRMRDDLRAAP